MGNSINVIIDTNVIVSAFLSKHSDTATSKALTLLYLKKICMFYSDEIINEYIDVLNRKKFNIRKEIVNNFINFVKLNAEKITPKEINNKTMDLKDQPFYELVMDDKIKDSKLITGNIKHFPISTKIMTPKQFIDYYNSIVNQMEL